MATIRAAVVITTLYYIRFTHKTTNKKYDTNNKNIYESGYWNVNECNKHTVQRLQGDTVRVDTKSYTLYMISKNQSMICKQTFDINAVIFVQLYWS